MIRFFLLLTLLFCTAGCRYEPELLSDFYGFVRLSAPDEETAIRPDFRKGGTRIYYYARQAGDSPYQLRVVDRDGSKRKTLIRLAYNPGKPV